MGKKGAGPNNHHKLNNMQLPQKYLFLKRGQLGFYLNHEKESVWKGTTSCIMEVILVFETETGLRLGGRGDA